MKKLINPYLVLGIGFLWAMAILIFVVLSIGCSTTNKTKSVFKSTTDSSSVVSIDSNVVKAVDSVSVKKDNTVTTTEKEDNYTKVTEIEFEPTSVTFTPAADYFPPVKRIKITETGVKKERTNIVQNKNDSTAKKDLTKIDLTKNVKSDVSKTLSVKEKEVHRTSYMGLFITVAICLLIFIVGWYFGWWRWIILLFKRRDDDYPVKYKKL